MTRPHGEAAPEKPDRAPHQGAQPPIPEATRQSRARAHQQRHYQARHYRVRHYRVRARKRSEP